MDASERIEPGRIEADETAQAATTGTLYGVGMGPGDPDLLTLKALRVLERAPVLVPDEQIPRVTYCDPEVASVGLSEEVARERFGEVETQTYDLAGNGRAQILQTSGFVKLVRRAGGPVVGVHLVGARVGELMGEAQAITSWEAWPEEVATLPHAHPTLDEALGEAHLALAVRPLHAHS